MKRLLLPALMLAGCWMQVCGAAEAYAQQVRAEAVAGTHYAPDANLEALDAAVIARARHSVNLAAFSLTDGAVVDALAAAAGRGVAVRIYLDRGELQAECRGDANCRRIALGKLIGLSGVEIRVKRSKVLMHLKSFSVDDLVVRDGSANFSEAGEKRQDNSAIFSFDAGPVGEFLAKFSAMWTRADNLTVAEAITAK